MFEWNKYGWLRDFINDLIYDRVKVKSISQLPDGCLHFVTSDGEYYVNGLDENATDEELMNPKELFFPLVKTEDLTIWCNTCITKQYRIDYIEAAKEAVKFWVTPDGVCYIDYKESN